MMRATKVPKLTILTDVVDSQGFSTVSKFIPKESVGALRELGTD